MFSVFLFRGQKTQKDALFIGAFSLYGLKHLTSCRGVSLGFIVTYAAIYLIIQLLNVLLISIRVIFSLFLKLRQVYSKERRKKVKILKLEI